MLSVVFGYLRKIPYYLFGIALLSFLVRFCQSYLKSRAVRKSQSQSRDDLQKLVKETEDAESTWVKEGKSTDKSLTDE